MRHRSQPKGSGRLLAALLAVLLSTAVGASAAGLFYREVEKDGRLYVFAVTSSVAAFEAAQQVGGGITREGYGPLGQTVVFDSEDAINLYNFKHGRPGEVFPPAKASKEAQAPRADFSIKLGATIFADYTYVDAPRISDSDANQVSLSAFEVRRAYINVTGQISDWIAFRVTPDVGARLAETVTVKAPPNAPPGTPLPAVGVGSNLDGSAVIRLKYAYGQWNLDKPLKSKGAWIRFGQQPTPYLDFMQAIYRYRFQGTMFVEREGFLSSADLGLSAQYVVPGGYLDVHAGYFNGDTYTKAEINSQKAFQIRGSVRPLPKHELLKGLRLHAFYVHDSPVQGGARERFTSTLTFEHERVNFGFDYLDAKDQPSARGPATSARGFSMWANPRTAFGLEGFLRYDHIRPNQSLDAKKTRTIVGAAYWFRDKLPLAAAILADFEQVQYDQALAKATEKRFEVKAYFNF